MAEFVINGIMTTAGLAAANAAKTGTKLNITKIAYGNARASISAATTSIGTVLLEVERHTRGHNLSGTNTELFFLLGNFPDRLGGTMGIYSGNTLLATSRFTPSASDFYDHIVVRISDLGSISFAALPAKNLLPATLIGDLYSRNHLRFETHNPVVSNSNDLSALGTATGKNISSYLMSRELPLLGTAAEIADHQANSVVSYFDLRDWFLWSVSGGTWYSISTAKLVVNKGMFYFSVLNNSLYYAREDTDLIFLSKFS